MSTMPHARARWARRSFTDNHTEEALQLALSEGMIAYRSQGETGVTTAEQKKLLRFRKEMRELRIECDASKKEQRWSSQRPTYADGL